MFETVLQENSLINMTKMFKCVWEYAYKFDRWKLQTLKQTTVWVYNEKEPMHPGLACNWNHLQDFSGI